MHAFLGAYRAPSYGESEVWTLTDDASRLADRTDDDVLFVDNAADLRAALDTRYGLTPTGLSRVESYTEACLRVYPHPRYHGTDLAELERHLRAHPAGMILCTRLHPDHVPESSDIVLSGGLARLDPARAQTRRKRAQARDARRALTLHDLRAWGDEMIAILRRQLKLHSLIWSVAGAASLRELASHLLPIASLFNAAFGTNAHRRLGGFQRLHAEWRAKPALNTQKFAGTIFGAWMAREAARKRLPPVQEAWSVPDLAAGLQPLEPAETAA